MMDCGKSKIASICMRIIDNPQENLEMIEKVLVMAKEYPEDGGARGVIYLSVLKVFKAVIPLYKVRSLKDVVKDKRDSLHLKDYDKSLLRWYTCYIRAMVDDGCDESYISLCEVLEHFDHFNCADKVVAGVLRGSLGKRAVAMRCCEAIRSRLREDCSGEVILTILNQMIESDYNPLILEYLVEIPFVDNSLKSDEERSREYWEENKPVAWGERRNSIFRRKKVFSKHLRKMEKERLKTQSMVKDEEDVEGRIEELKNSKKIYDAIQRLYFSILKGDRYDCYKQVFIGLVKYKKIIRAEFMEGLYFLLNNSFAKISPEAKVQGILCIVSLYGNEGYDFNRLVNALYSMVHPMTPEEVDCSELVKAIRLLFIKVRQPAHRAHILLKRLILYGCTRFVPKLKGLIKDLAICYDIEFSDCTSTRCREFDNDATNVDSIPDNPFFEYFLYKQML